MLIEQMPAAPILHADKGYDSNAIREQVRGRGAFANIPPKATLVYEASELTRELGPGLITNS